MKLWHNGIQLHLSHSKRREREKKQTDQKIGRCGRTWLGQNHVPDEGQFQLTEPGRDGLSFTHHNSPEYDESKGERDHRVCSVGGGHASEEVEQKYGHELGQQGTDESFILVSEFVKAQPVFEEFAHLEAVRGSGRWGRSRRKGTLCIIAVQWHLHGSILVVLLNIRPSSSPISSSS